MSCRSNRQTDRLSLNAYQPWNDLVYFMKLLSWYISVFSSPTPFSTKATQSISVSDAALYTEGSFV